MAAPGNENPFASRTAHPVPGGDLSLRHTFLALFLFPHVVLLNARHRPLLGRAALLAGLVLVACSLVLGLGRSAQTLRQVEEAAAWLGRQMGELRRNEDGTLGWNRPEDAPATLDFQGFRVDFAAPGSQPDLKKLAADSPGGLWITPAEVRFWPFLAGRMSLPVFLADSPLEAYNWKQRFPVGTVVAGERFAPLARQWLRWSVPVFMAFFYLFAIGNIYVVFLAMFTILPLILRQERTWAEARTALCVNLHCSVAPLIVATAYHLAAPRALDFSTLFVFAFLGYLIWAFSRVRRFLAGDARHPG